MRPFAVTAKRHGRARMVGLLVYWLTNRSSELFPGPTQDGR
jgi:hypothetical protein